LGFSNVAIGPIDAVEIDADCNLANFFTNDISDFGLFSANPDVAAISGHMVTLVGPGTTEITASWDTVSVQQHCIGFASDGECVDAMCPTNNVATPAETQATVRPMITSITPAASAVGHPVTVTLSGSGFAGGASVSAGSGVTVSEITVSSSTSMSATFSVDANAAAGDRDVTVTVNGQTSNSKTFTVQVPDRLSVVSDTGNAPFQNCPNVKGRLITYQILDSSSSHSPIAQALDVAEALDNLTSNTCGNGQPDPSVCESTSSSGQFTDGIAITVNCASAVALSNCASNPSCGYEYTQRWSTCFPEAIIELMSVPGITHCNEIKINNATQLSTGTVMPK